MAPQKPLGTDKHQGVGFHQEYNQDPGPSTDLNPAAVTEDTVLPAPKAKPRAVKAPRAAKRVAKASKARK